MREATEADCVFMHPPEVVEALGRLKERPNYGDTLTQPDHWIIKYSEQKGLVRIDNAVCGPLQFLLVRNSAL